MAASNGSEYFELDIDAADHSFSFARPSNAEFVARDEQELLWAAIERLPSQKQTNFALLTHSSSEISDDSDGVNRTETIDVRKLDKNKRKLVVKNALATDDQDNFRLLSGIKHRLDRY